MAHQGQTPHPLPIPHIILRLLVIIHLISFIIIITIRITVFIILISIISILIIIVIRLLIIHLLIGYRPSAVAHSSDTPSPLTTPLYRPTSSTNRLLKPTASITSANAALSLAQGKRPPKEGAEVSVAMPWVSDRGPGERAVSQPFGLSHPIPILCNHHPLLHALGLLPGTR